MFRVRISKAQLYERLLEERERLVQVLSAERQTWVPPATGPVIEMTGFPDGINLTAVNALSDEEEQLTAMLQAGAISQVEYDAAIERIKGRDPSDIIE